MTPQQIQAPTTTAPAEDVIQRHDRLDEADQGFQNALHELAKRCGECGQALPEVTA